MAATILFSVAPSNPEAVPLRDQSQTKVPWDLLLAYRETRFLIETDPPFEMRPTVRSPELAALMAQHSARSASTITAWNPHSVLTDADANHRAQAELIAELDRLGLTHFGGFGRDPSGVWPGEATRLVLGIDDETLFALGRRFDQNAVVRARADAIPIIVALR